MMSPMPTTPRLLETFTLETGPKTIVHEQGWQSWSPSATYPIDGVPHRSTHPDIHVMNYRSDRVPAPGTFQGEGLLAVRAGPDAPVHVFAAPSGATDIASIAATRVGDRLEIRASAPVEHMEDAGRGGIGGALARWADRYAATTGVGTIRPAPTGWCSWYHYFAGVTAADMDENVDRMGELDLPIDVVQLDDGYEAQIGDWLELSERFASLEAVVARIRAAGRRAGVWVAPFLLGGKSRTLAEHPDWAIGGPDTPVDAGRNWDQRVYALDTTHPGAQAYLRSVFGTLGDIGFDFLKIDFLYAGAMPGPRHAGVDPVTAYREGLRVIRAAAGDAYVLGCGAPILPSVGLVDAMRISPDTAPEWEPPSGDLAHPSGRASILTGESRAFAHARFWVNDADCLIVRPAVERREALAEHVERFGGLRMSSDRLADLDDWGLATTRRLLSSVPAEPFVPS